MGLPACRGRLSAAAGRATRLVIAAAFGVFLGLRPADAAAQFIPPDARWSTFDTEHFEVTFTPGLEPLARRAAWRAEHAYTLLSEALLPPPRGRIHLVITDNVDYANGFATVVPRNRIVAYAHPPSDERYLRYYEDWLDILVLHELVHIFHLNDAGGAWRLIRSILGRSPIAFPNAYAPEWMLEGLATYAESYTGAGRVRGSMYEMILRTAVLDGRLAPIDHVTAEPASWPAGIAQYLYGAFLFDYLAGSAGSESISAFLRSASRQVIPYRLDAVARGTLGTSLTAAWEAWSDSLGVRYTALADSLASLGLTEPEILTDEGWVAEYPRFSRTGVLLTYSGSTGREEASVALLWPGGKRTRLAPATAIGPVAWIDSDAALLVAQLEFTDPYSVRSDLFRLQPGGKQERLTRGARVSQPHAHPDGRRAVVVSEAGGTNVVAIVDLATGDLAALTKSDLDVQWADPRWSPDGRYIAVTRWAGGRADIVVLDTAGVVVEEVTRDRALDTYPAWSPDGRYIVFSSDRGGITNLVAYDWVDRRHYQVTNVLTGAFQPDVSPDGRWIAFSYYQSDGYHIARVPFAPENWRSVEPRFDESDPAPATEQDQIDPIVRGEVRPYSAWSTLPPTWWLPIIADDDWPAVGVVTGGSDVLQRHSWSAEALAFPTEGRAAGGLAYRYRGLGSPVLDVGALQDWRVQNVAPSPTDEPLPELARRDRELEATLSWQYRRWRRAGWVQVSGDVREVAFIWSDPPEGGQAREDVRYPLDLGASVGVGFSTVRAFPLSLGPQQGIRTSLRVEGRHYVDEPPVANSRRDYWRVVSDNEAYGAWDIFGFAPTTLALRLDAGVETSEAAPGFTIGGVSASGSDLAIDLGVAGTSSAYPVRGYPSGVQRGNRVLSGTAEYRFPLVLVERGYRLLPVAVDRLWGDVFVDAGAAWCPGGCRSGLPNARGSFRPLMSAGAETVLELRLGYRLDVPLRVGAAIPLRDRETYDSRLYLRIGRAF